MNFLIDTHTLLWVLEDSKNLSSVARSTVQATGNNVFVSTINFWEISLKVSIGKMTLKGVEISKLPDLVTKMGLDILSLSAEDASSFHQLKAIHHRDPFDRMLIWQAIRNKHILITKDPIIRKYEDVGLVTLW